MSRILVTGGAGFIGSNFVSHLIDEYPDVEVTVLDKLTYAGNLKNLAHVAEHPRFHFVKGDIADPKIVAEVVEGCDWVYNFAAETHVDRSIHDAEAVVWTNVRGTQVLLDAAREFKIPRFVQISTDEVYGSRKTGFFTEKDPVQPSNPYSACKAAADLLVLSYVSTYKLPAIITRSSNNYGPFQHPEKLIPLHITNALEGKDLPIYGDGRNARDWLYVMDNCRAIDRVGRHGKVGEIYNIAGRNERENLFIVDKIVELTGCSADLKKFVTDRPGHDFRYAISDARLHELGYAPQCDLEEGLRRTVSWYQDHTEWWQETKSGEFKAYYRKQYAQREEGSERQGDG